MASFVSRLVACLVAVVAILQLIHLVLLNKLESTRLNELRRLQQQQQYHHLKQQNEDNAFQDVFPFMSEKTNQSPHQLENSFQGNKENDNGKQHWSYWRSERSIAGSGLPPHPSQDVPEPEIRFDHLLREDQGAVVDSTGEYRIMYDVAGPHAGSPAGSLQHGGTFVIEKDAHNQGTNAQTDDFSIDDENFDGLAPPVDVTLSTFGNYQKSMQHLIPLVSVWNGPLSVALFASSAGEMQLLLEFISKARMCHGPTKQYVSFHLVFPLVETHSARRGARPHNVTRFEKWKSKQEAHLQQQHNKRLNPNSSSSSSNPNSIIKMPTETTIGKSCQSFRDQVNKFYKTATSGESGNKRDSSRKNSFNDKNTIPSNLLRNVARRRVVTEYSFAIDLGMIPSRDLRANFQQFARNRLASGSSDDKKTAFVVPAFEITADAQIPLVKQQLLNLVDKKKARPYQFDLCWKCQMYTDYETWQKESSSKNNNKLGILFEVLWKDPWEPFFISHNDIPIYDERFRSSSVTRTSQLCELHVAGYKFAVLNDAFLVHRGYSVVPKSLDERNKYVDTSQAHFRQFKIELKDKYPQSTRRCY